MATLGLLRVHHCQLIDQFAEFVAELRVENFNGKLKRVSSVGTAAIVLQRRVVREQHCLVLLQFHHLHTQVTSKRVWSMWFKPVIDL